MLIAPGTFRSADSSRTECALAGRGPCLETSFRQLPEKLASAAGAAFYTEFVRAPHRPEGPGSAPSSKDRIPIQTAVRASIAAGRPVGSVCTAAGNQRHSWRNLAGLMEPALTTWSSLNLLQQAVIAGAGFVLVYWVLEAAVGTRRRWARLATILLLLGILCGVTARLAAPEVVCSVPWPAPLSGLCS